MAEETGKWGLGQDFLSYQCCHYKYLTGIKVNIQRSVLTCCSWVENVCGPYCLTLLLKCNDQRQDGQIWKLCIIFGIRL